MSQQGNAVLLNRPNPMGYGRDLANVHPICVWIDTGQSCTYSFVSASRFRITWAHMLVCILGFSPLQFPETILGQPRERGLQALKLAIGQSGLQYMQKNLTRPPSSYCARVFGQIGLTYRRGTHQSRRFSAPRGFLPTAGGLVE